MVGMEGMGMSKVVNLGNGEVLLNRPKRRVFSPIQAEVPGGG